MDYKTILGDKEFTSFPKLWNGACIHTMDCGSAICQDLDNSDSWNSLLKFIRLCHHLSKKNWVLTKRNRFNHIYETKRYLDYSCGKWRCKIAKLYLWITCTYQFPLIFNTINMYKIDACLETFSLLHWWLGFQNVKYSKVEWMSSV